MPAEITIKLYEYAELPTEEAKEKAREWFTADGYDFDGINDDDWYEEMLADIGLKPIRNAHGSMRMYFDLDRADYLYFQDLRIDDLAKFAKAAGLDRRTKAYRMAEEEACIVTRQYGGGRGRNAVEPAELFTLQTALDAVIDKIKEELRDEYEYRMSREYVEEMIDINAYTFLENGERFESDQCKYPTRGTCEGCNHYQAACYWKRESEKVKA